MASVFRSIPRIGRWIHLLLLFLLCASGARGQYDNCTYGDVNTIRDGKCDDINNNEECLYDGGDCCECTVVTSLDYFDPENELLCRDPNSGCVDSRVGLYPSCTDGDIFDIGDGRCDDENNNEECGYDGGDCCDCTVKTTLEYFYAEDDRFCRDPNSDCVDPRVASYPNCTNGNIPEIGNGQCDSENNNKGCHYDGGDCCDCNTTDDASSPYYFSTLCVDPSASCYDSSAKALQSNCTDGYIPRIGDGECDTDNNNEGCLYDGGDCCDCNTTDDASSSYYSFTLCVDPSASCFNSSAAVLQSNCTDGSIPSIGNGQCDIENNIEGCLYDGGDCCNCIDGGSSSYQITSSSFRLCVDPSASCYDPSALTLRINCTDGYIPSVENGQCDIENNIEGCLYDGGDCCECTRTNDESSFNYQYSSSLTLCVDPSAPCYDSSAAAVQSSCTNGYVPSIGDGRCDEENNFEGCMFDGGDCCLCSCSYGQTYDCGISGFPCLDPDVFNREGYICVEPPPVLSACPVGLQREWIVDNSSQARELAEAVRCSGGSFNVTWKSKVIVDDTILIFGGTTLDVTSVDADAAIVGNGKTRLFTGVDASLNLRNITLSNGSAIYGGAIAVLRSSLTLDRVSFIGNTASNAGGAVHVSNRADVSFDGETTFCDNNAFDGGAIYIEDGSTALWRGHTVFSNNSASGNGGGVFVASSSSTVWTAKSHFLSNSANFSGGALHLANSSNASWSGETAFFYNTAIGGGGALYVGTYSSTVWTATLHFLANSANLSGGALYVEESSNASFAGETTFVENAAAGDGGAMYVGTYSNIIWTTASHYISNSAQSSGGGVTCVWPKQFDMGRSEHHFE